MSKELDLTDQAEIDELLEYLADVEGNLAQEVGRSLINRHLASHDRSVDREQLLHAIYLIVNESSDHAAEAIGNERTCYNVEFKDD